VKAYEVLIQPSDGDLLVSPPVVGTVYQWPHAIPSTLYRVMVKSIGEGGGRSFPSKEVLLFTLSQEAMMKKLYQEQGEAGPKESVAKGLYGKVDPVGLQLSWTAPKEKGVIGYNLYRQSPSGQMEKVSRSPKQSTKVWATGVSGLWGWQWMVTAVYRGDRERTVGTYLWYPDPKEIEELSRVSPRHLRAVPQPKRQVFLVWDGDPDATGYTLLYSLEGDGIYETFKEIKKADTNLLLDIPGGGTTYYFIIVPRKPNGEWTLSTQEAKVQLYQDAPAQ
jgi:hypothetical protein